MAPVPIDVSAVHEAGHVIVALSHGIRVYRVSIQQIDDLRWGYTLTGKPEPNEEALAAACAGLAAPARFRACRAYAQVALGGIAAEVLDQRLRHRPLSAPTPCTDARAAETYLRLASTRGRLADGAVNAELRRAQAILSQQARAWRAIADELVRRGALDEDEIADAISTSGASERGV